MERPRVVVAEASRRLTKSGSGLHAVLRLRRRLKAAVASAASAERGLPSAGGKSAKAAPGPLPAEVEFDLGGVLDVAASGLRSLMWRVRVLAWNGVTACPLRVLISNVDPELMPQVVDAAEKRMAGIALVERGSDHLWLEVGPWRRSQAKQDLIDRLVERDGVACAWCSRTVDPESAEATLDHVLPASRGGQYLLDNLLLSCRPCNGERGDLEAEEFRRRLRKTQKSRQGLVREDVVSDALARMRSGEDQTFSSLS